MDTESLRGSQRFVNGALTFKMCVVYLVGLSKVAASYILILKTPYVRTVCSDRVLTMSKLLHAITQSTLFDVKQLAHRQHSIPYHIVRTYSVFSV